MDFMQSDNYVSRKDFEADCKKRIFNMQEEQGRILAFSGEEYMGSFDGTEGFLLLEKMVRPVDKMKCLN